MNSQKWQALFCGAIVLLGPTEGHGESRPRSSDKDAFHFTAPVDFEPWVIHRSDGTFDGIIYRLAAEIANEMGMPLKFHVLPFARLAKEGKAINFEVTLTESDKMPI